MTKEPENVKALIAKHKVEAAKAAVAQQQSANREKGIAARLAKWLSGNS